MPTPEIPPDLRRRASEELNQAQAALAHIQLLSQATNSYRIELDRQAVPSLSELEVNPGEHHLRISSATSVVFEQTLKLEPGERLKLRVTDQERTIDVVVVPEAKPTAKAAPTAAPAARTGLPPAVFYGAASASLVLAGFTVWSGLDVKSAYSDYQHDLPRLTQAEADQRVEDGHARERRTNILLGATAVGVVASAALALFWVDFSPRTTQVSIGVSNGRAVLSGRF
ncbi:MAG: hypothetical protein QM756_04090 [Polyangiaceae bacterium]